MFQSQQSCCFADSSENTDPQSGLRIETITKLFLETHGKFKCVLSAGKNPECTAEPCCINMAVVKWVDCPCLSHLFVSGVEQSRILLICGLV